MQFVDRNALSKAAEISGQEEIRPDSLFEAG